MAVVETVEGTALYTLSFGGSLIGRNIIAVAVTPTASTSPSTNPRIRQQFAPSSRATSYKLF